jgi:hypothetical protein
MDALAMSRYITEMFADVETTEAFGYTFFFYRDDHKLPFATLATGDNEYDRVGCASEFCFGREGAAPGVVGSGLARPWRLGLRWWRSSSKRGLRHHGSLRGPFWCDWPNWSSVLTHPRRALLPNLIPAVVAHRIAQRQHRVHTRPAPMHPRPFQPCFDHQLVGALYHPAANRPAGSPILRILHLPNSLLQVGQVFCHHRHLQPLARNAA